MSCKDRIMSHILMVEPISTTLKTHYKNCPKNGRVNQHVIFKYGVSTNIGLVIMPSVMP